LSQSLLLTGAWQKSSFSESGACVEARVQDDLVQVRNTRDRLGPVLTFTFAEWRAFLKGVAHGEFAIDINNDVR